MKNQNNGAIRIIIVLLAVVTVALTALFVINNVNSPTGSPEQKDQSTYGADQNVSNTDGYIVADDSTQEMDSIPNGVDASGSDATVSGSQPAE